jgi:hypothetical protein
VSWTWRSAAWTRDGGPGVAVRLAREAIQLALLDAHPILEADATIGRLLAGHRATAGPRSRKAEPQSVRLNLEQHLGVRKARKAMSTETAEPDAGRDRCSDRCSGRSGNDDLSPAGRRAVASRGVDGQTDVPDIGQRRPAASPSSIAPLPAIDGAVAIQRALGTHAWPDDLDVRLRVGIHKTCGQR